MAESPQLRWGVLKDPEGAEVEILRRLVPLSGKRVLEVGCGDGRLTRQCASTPRHVVAIDPDARSIARAKKYLPSRWAAKVTLEAGSAEALRFPARSFDIVFYSWSF
ncbi:MAG: class I SAM-dependent methyltransferase [Armatimonadetes bacterium]|nr:class I SAM-dependent methyltransferase [Armatimonadota bacterium]